MVHVSLMLAATLASAAVPGSSPTLFAFAAVSVALTVPYAFPGKLSVVSSVLYCVLAIAVLALDLLPVVGVPLP